MPPMSCPADGFDGSASRFMGPRYTRRTVLASTNHRPMARVQAVAHRVPMVEIILLIGTGLALLVLLAAVALELDEERRDERELGVHVRVRKP